MNICIFYHTEIGQKIVDFVQKNYKDDLKLVISLEDFKNIDIYKLKEQNLDYIILAWWPKIIKSDIINIPKIGVLNLHPSLLPYNRGKNYWFWNIVEDVPYGVTIHFVDESIDGGDIIFQKEIEKTWEDTGETLFQKARIEIVNLFKESYPKLITGNYTRKKQTKSIIHYSKELDAASEIHLDKLYTGRKILNILRARTSKNFPKCYFNYNNKIYEIYINIKEKKDIN